MVNDCIVSRHVDPILLSSKKHRSFYRSSHWRCSVRKGVLRNFAKFTGKHLCQSLLFNNVPGPCNFIKKETLAQVFSCEFCEISKNTFFTEHIWQLLLFLSLSVVPLLVLFNFYYRAKWVLYLQALVAFIYFILMIFVKKLKCFLSFFYNLLPPRHWWFHYKNICKQSH